MTSRVKRLFLAMRRAEHEAALRRRAVLRQLFLQYRAKYEREQHEKQSGPVLALKSRFLKRVAELREEEHVIKLRTNGAVWRHDATNWSTANDPRHLIQGKWYHTDETWGEAYGPYPTARQAEAALDFYCKHYLGAEISAEIDQ